MATYLHPGIYIEEIPGARSIQGASTSVAAFIGGAEMGPFNVPTLITSWNAFTRQFGSLTWNGFMPWTVYEFFQEGGTSCYVVRTRQTGSGQGTLATATVGGTTFSTASMGTWGNLLQVYICNGSSGSPSSGSSDQTPIFNVQVVVPDSVINPSQPPTDQATQMLIAYVNQNGLARTPIGDASSGSASYYYVLEAFSGFTSADASFASRINTQSIFIRVTQYDKTRPDNTSAPVPFTNGQNASWDISAALNTLETVQALSLLAMPDTVGITNSSGVTDPVTQSEWVNQGLSLCEKLASLFYVIDPPYGQDVAGVLSFKNGTPPPGTSQGGQAINSSYGALYYPWAWIFNPLSNSNVPMPPSGPSLGRYAYTDGSIGVWKAPAGVNDGAMRTVTALFMQLTDADQDTLNPNGINALRNLINYGNVIYGARTVSQDSQWTYLSVRRLFIFVEQSLRNSLQWVVFEPNDQQLWAAVTRDISAFLTTLWQQGALFGATAQEAFFVTCDASNNPPETRQLGQLIIDIGLAPVYPAEFVIIRITQKTAGPDSGS
ncbi:phage tail sheath C-terminal domain-containing protein [Dyella sp. M7H15-1]|uniref:phage tail sheath family protein n=1 Tax=Dyella sp. M7H15-1 TaxID=2501295 RepID=UPI00197A7F38|nr:phage tail sheath C-terminal domain-containing protein [Dyella sp. M7H15-1]